MFKVEWWYVMGKEITLTMANPLISYKISYYKFGMWFPLRQDGKHCRVSQLAHKVQYTYANMYIHGLHWRRFFFNEDPVYKWLANVTEDEVTSTQYNSIEEFKTLNAEYFI